ncbi:MAG: glycosyltransferase family A protein [Leifsonia sp.]
MTRASILIPSHNRPRTLALAVASALAQTVDDIEVIVIGDGVTTAVRETALRLSAADRRVVFLDLPKGENHGETHRDAAIRSARSDAIFYLCDDDLLLPSHVADLLTLLEGGRTFVQSLNGYVGVEGGIHRYGGSLSDPEAIAWTLRHDLRYSFVSVTGTAHSRLFYLSLGESWSTTPPGEWPDHYQWRKMIGQPGFVGETSGHMTALQFPATQIERRGWDEARQLRELEEWTAFIRTPGAQERVDALAAAATEWELAHNVRELLATRGTLSWRITKPLRAIRGPFWSGPR